MFNLNRPGPFPSKGYQNQIIMKIFTTMLAGIVLFATACNNAKDISQPEFRDFSDVRLLETGLLKTTAGANVIYYNPNNFSIQLSSARGDVYIDDSYLGTFELDQEVLVRKRSEFTLPVLLKIDNISAIKNQHDIYKKKEVMVRIEGRALVRKSGFTKEIPISYEQMQDTDRLRALVTR